MMRDRSTIAVLDRVQVVRDIEAQSEPQETAAVLDRVLAAIHPLAGLIPDNSHGREVQSLIKSTEGDFAERIDRLLYKADALLIVLHNIHTHLGQIENSTISMKELGNTSTRAVLRDLWVSVMGKRKVKTEAKGYKKLLGEIPLFYDMANAVVQDVNISLLKAKADMKSLDLLARIRVKILLEVYPPHLIATALRRSAETLEESTQKVKGRRIRIAQVIAKGKKRAA